MILVDTSLWVDHLRTPNGPMVSLLQTELVCTHAWVIGELACDNIRNRQEILKLLSELPRVAAASDEEVLHFIELHRLMGRGIGYIDAHLLAATALNAARIWTRDKRLHGIAEELGLAHSADAH